MKSDRLSSLSVFALFVALLLAEQTARADSALYQKALRGTGWVVVPSTNGLSCGTCWLADRERRLVVTCQHVLGKSTEALVYFPRFDNKRPVVEAGRYLKGVPAVVGQVVTSDPLRDLAVLRLAVVPEGVQELPLAEHSCAPGDDVHSIGNSGVRGGLDEATLWWYTRGSVRQVHRRKIQGEKTSRHVWLVETQAPVNEGDSGGPVVDRAGRVVGVTTSYTGGQRLVSQNVDVREVKVVLEEAVDCAEDAVEGPSPCGCWKFCAQGEKGKSMSGKGEFRTDGTFKLVRPGKPLEGRYAYANGLLCLIVEDGLAALRPAWTGKDRFCVKLGDASMTFDRHAAEAAEEVAKEP